MALLLSPFPTHPTGDGPCFCCRRDSCQIGIFVGGSLKSIIWSCVDHIRLADKSRAMMPKKFGAYEERALLHAGDQAGAYLDSIGKTDLATLTQEEWAAFLASIINNFGQRLAALLDSDVAPF